MLHISDYEEMFDKLWCSECKLPKKFVDLSFPLKCILHNTGFEQQMKRWKEQKYKYMPVSKQVGITNICLESTDTIKPVVVGYVLLYDMDFPSMLDTPRYETNARLMGTYIASKLGTCFVFRTARGYWLVSPSILTYEEFRDIAVWCMSRQASDHRFLVLRVSTKADEHVMKRFICFYEAREYKHDVSSIHFNTYNLIAEKQVKLKYHRLVDTDAFMVRYVSWSK